jgi:cyclopropane fatty-acyl-phospholipid synthase-like methyltransferase
MKTYVTDICPLCQKIQSSAYFSDKNRDYLFCQHCFLVYVQEKFYLSASDEKKQYDYHTNNPDDKGYRQFLSRLFNPLAEMIQLKELDGPIHGLDFGSGPGPTLSIMFEEIGFDMQIYDLYYANDENVFNRTYDFVTSTEVIEHLKNPKLEIERLLSVLKPNGLLAIMTKRVINKESFKSWHYKNDPTHICFYSKETFNWIAMEYALAIKFIAADVVILQKVL